MIYTITTGYSPARIWALSLASYKKHKNPDVKYTHIYVDNHYPLNIEQNRAEIKRICQDNDVIILNPGRNLGLHDGFNYALKYCDIKPYDIIIGYDGDSNPISYGFDGALVHALEFDHSLGWVSLMSPRAKPEILSRGYTAKQVRHLELWLTHKAVVNSVCAFRGEFLLKTGGLKEENAIYGGLEAVMFPKLREMGLHWGFLTGWHEDDLYRDMQDKEYLWWKWKYAHLKEFSGDFASYVSAGCPPPSDLPLRLS